MKKGNAVKRFFAFMLAMALILGEMPAISARADEGKISFTGEKTFELIDADSEGREIGFSDGWKSEDGIYYSNLFYDFPEESRPTLAAFAAEYSKLNASFKVFDSNNQGTVNACRFTFNLIKNVEGNNQYEWLSRDLEEAVDLGDGEKNISINLGDTDYSEADGWFVSGVSLEIESSDVNNSFSISGKNWVVPTYIYFSGEGIFSLIEDEEYCQTVQFSSDWSDGERYFANFGSWYDSENAFTISDFASKYSKVLVDMKIAKLLVGSDARVDGLYIGYKADLSDEDEEEKGINVDIENTYLTEGGNTFSFDLSQKRYDELCANYYVTSIAVTVSSSNVNETFKIYHRDAILPSPNTFYFANDWDWENNCLPEGSGFTDKKEATCGVGENLTFMYYEENEAGELIAKVIPITDESGALLNPGIKIYYQEDEDSERVLSTEGINYNQQNNSFLLDPFIGSDEPYHIGYYIFKRVGIYSFECSDESYPGTVKVYVTPSEWSFYDKNNALMTSENQFTRKSGESITLSPEDKNKEYSIIILAHMGYGSDGDPSRYFVTAKDSNKNDVTDKICFTNEQILENDDLVGYADRSKVCELGELPTFKGDMTFTLTDFAHNCLEIFVRYEGEGGYDYYCYTWDESKASIDANPREDIIVGKDSTIKGFTGRIINEAEYRSGSIDFELGQPLVACYGESMKAVIDELSASMRDGSVENYGYIWIESGYVVNDPVSVENTKKEQYISSDIGGAADIKGVLLKADSTEFDYNLDFTPEFKTALVNEIAGETQINEHNLMYSWLTADNDSTDTFTVAVQWAKNIMDPDDCVYLIPATTDNEYAFYFLNGTPEDGFTISDPVLEIDEIHPDSGVNYKTIKNHANGKYYKVEGWYGVEISFPKLHVDATNEMFILGAFADVPENEASIFMKLAPGSKSIINGDIYTMSDEGNVTGKTRSGETFTLVNGSIKTNSGAYSHWQLGEVNYKYSVLVDKLEVRNTFDMSEESNIGDADINTDLDSIYDQIMDEMSDEDKAKVEGGNNITFETEITDVSENDIPETMEDALEEANAQNVELFDVVLEYFVGYGNESKNYITETDDAVYLSITLMGEEYTTEVGKYVIGRYHEDKYEEITPDSVVAIEGGVIVTFKSNKFSTYAIIYGSNKKTVSVADGNVVTAYLYGETPAPEGLSIEVNFENGDHYSYSADKASELGYNWIFVKADGTVAEKDSDGYYPIGSYKWILADNEGGTVATTNVEILVKNGYRITYVLAGGSKKNNAAFVSRYFTDSESVILPKATDFAEDANYVFAGWYTSSSYKANELVTVINPDKYKDYVFYAKWVARTTAIEFNSNGGNNGGATKGLVIYNLKAAVLTNNGFKDKNRAFMGWGLTPDATVAAFKNKDSVTLYRTKAVNDGNEAFVTKLNNIDVSSYVQNGKITLYAVWDSEFDVTYINDGSIYLKDTYTYNVKKVLDSTIKTTKPGYTFAGWYNEQGKKVNEISKGYSGDIVLTARWTANSYTIKYNKNAKSGVSGGMGDTKTKYDTETGLRVNAFKRPGYKFIGWNTDQNATVAIYSDGQTVSNLAVSGNVILYAVWEKTDYTITFDSMCNLEELVGGKVEPLVFEYSTSKGDELPKPVRNNYTFIGWYKEPAYKSQVKTTKGLSSDITLYARWSTKYVIHFEANGGIANKPMADMVNVEYSSKKNLSSNKYSYKDAAGNIYAFMGWDTDPSADEVVYTNGQSLIYPSEIKYVDGKFVLNLYAVWECKWNIYYNVNGGTLPEEVVNEYSFKVGVKTLPVPAKEGYTFAGWYKDDKLKSKVTSISTSSTKDIQLYAKWTPKTYTIVYNSNAPEGCKVTGSTGKQKLSYEVSKAMNKNGFKINGYNFLGWSSSPSATEAEFTNGQLVSGFGDYKTEITLYAVWELAEYKVTYKFGGDAEDIVDTYTVKTGYTLRGEPTRIGYTFKGYYTNKTFSKAAKNLNPGATGDLIIYAKWVENK